MVNDSVIFEGKKRKNQRSRVNSELSDCRIEINTVRKVVWQILKEKSGKFTSQRKWIEPERTRKKVQESTEKPEKVNRKERVLWRAMWGLPTTAEHFADQKRKIPICAKITLNVSFI